jgi:PIN domain nuclease of toxin-antitoxin system
MSIKAGTGKLKLVEPVGVLLGRELPANDFDLLPIALDHFAAVQFLPHHHRDPFDRMLIAQALREGLTVVGVDTQFDAYGVPRVW